MVNSLRSIVSLAVVLAICFDSLSISGRVFGLDEVPEQTSKELPQLREEKTDRRREEKILLEEFIQEKGKEIGKIHEYFQSENKSTEPKQHEEGQDIQSDHSKLLDREERIRRRKEREEEHKQHEELSKKELEVKEEKETERERGKHMHEEHAHQDPKTSTHASHSVNSHSSHSSSGNHSSSHSSSGDHSSSHSSSGDHSSSHSSSGDHISSHSTSGDHSSSRSSSGDHISSHSSSGDHSSSHSSSHSSGGKAEGGESSGDGKDVNSWMLTELKQRTESAEQKAETVQEKLNREHDKREHTKKELAGAEHTIAKLQEQLSLMKHSQEEAKREKEALRAKLGEATGQQKHLKDKVDATSRQQMELAAAASKELDNSENSGTDQRLLKASLKAMHHNLHTLKENSDTLREQLKAANEETKRLQSELAARSQSHEETKTERQDKAVAHLEEVIHSMRDQSHQLSSQLASEGHGGVHNHSEVEAQLLEHLGQTKETRLDLQEHGNTQEERSALEEKLERQVHMAIAFVAGLKAKLDHGSKVLKDALARAREAQLDEEGMEENQEATQGGPGVNGTLSKVVPVLKEWSRAGQGLEELLSSVDGQTQELQDLLIQDNSTDSLEWEVQKKLQEAEHRVSALEARILTGDLGGGATTSSAHSKKKMQELEEELVQAQERSREVQMALSNLTDLHHSQEQHHLAEHSTWNKEKDELDRQMKEVQNRLEQKIKSMHVYIEEHQDPLKQIKNVHDKVMSSEYEDNDDRQDQDLIMRLYTQHVQSVGQAFKEHMGPLVHEAEEAINSTSSKVEEVIYEKMHGIKDPNHLDHGYTRVGHTLHVAVCFLVICLPLTALLTLYFCLNRYFSPGRLLSLQGLITLFHQYGAGLCYLGGLAEMWSGLEPMHLFFALDFHSYVVFNFLLAAVFSTFWLALLLQAIIARGKGKVITSGMQLLVVSAIGNEWYYSVFHQAVIHRPPHMSITIYASFAVAFTLLSVVSKVVFATPQKVEETKSL